MSTGAELIDRYGHVIEKLVEFNDLRKNIECARKDERFDPSFTEQASDIVPVIKMELDKCKNLYHKREDVQLPINLLRQDMEEALAHPNIKTHVSRFVFFPFRRVLFFLLKNNLLNERAKEILLLMSGEAIQLVVYFTVMRLRRVYGDKISERDLWSALTTHVGGFAEKWSECPTVDSLIRKELTELGVIDQNLITIYIKDVTEIVNMFFKIFFKTHEIDRRLYAKMLGFATCSCKTSRVKVCFSKDKQSHFIMCMNCAHLLNIKFTWNCYNCGKRLATIVTLSKAMDGFIVYISCSECVPAKFDVYTFSQIPSNPQSRDLKAISHNIKDLYKKKREAIANKAAQPAQPSGDPPEPPSKKPRLIERLTKKLNIFSLCSGAKAGSAASQSAGNGQAQPVMVEYFTPVEKTPFSEYLEALNNNVVSPNKELLGFEKLDGSWFSSNSEYWKDDLLKTRKGIELYRQLVFVETFWYIFRHVKALDINDGELKALLKAVDELLKSDAKEGLTSKQISSLNGLKSSKMGFESTTMFYVQEFTLLLSQLGINVG